MPLCHHEEFKRMLKLGKRRRYQNDDEKVFYCDTSKRIFRDYEEYALNIIANSSTIWKCRVTGCENLTYSEAVQSEKLARESKHILNENLRPVVLIFIKTIKQSSLKSLFNLNFEFIQNRFFVNERVKVCQESHEKTAFIITNIKPKSKMLPTSHNISYRPDQVEYTVRNEHELENNKNELTLQFEQIKRYRNSLTFSIIKDFIEKNVITVNSILCPKPESYKKYVIDRNVTFDKVFIGKIPDFYNHKRDKFVKEKAMALCRLTDDLERFDQKLLPKYEKVNTNIPTDHFGDAIMLCEFLHSFSKIHSYKSFDKKNITLSELTRAFTTRETNGPLSGILINLLQTIFNLQKAEESEYPVWYTGIEESKLELEPFKAMNEAYKTHVYISSHFFLKLYELPLNAYTLSEILRLHFLSSGVPVKDATEMYRQMYRNGYSSKEDPGLMFRMEQPLVMDSLKTLSVYQLPIQQIFQIINTLIAQILSYSPAITMIDKQMNRITQLKIETNAYRQLRKQHNKTIQTRVDSSEIYKIRKLSNSLFGFKAFLGMDRAYRKYYVLRSIPGVFVEHSLDCLKECLYSPPKNVPSFVNHPKQKFLTQNYLAKLYNRVRRNQLIYKCASQDKNNNLERKELNCQTLKPKSASVNDILESSDKIEIDVDKEEATVNANPSQYELMMCTGSPTSCIVHNVNNPDRQRWAYFYKEEHIDAVIRGLNPFGDRESKLKKSLSMMRDLIVDHVKNFPVDKLSLNSPHIEQLTAQQIKSTEGPNLNEELHMELMNQIIKLKKQIITCKLKSKVEIHDYTIYPDEELACNDKQLESVHKEFMKENNEQIVSKRVKDLSLLLLNIKQSINEIFLQKQNFERWEISLKTSTSYSQVFLHLNILDREIM